MFEDNVSGTHLRGEATGYAPEVQIETSVELTEEVDAQELHAEVPEAAPVEAETQTEAKVKTEEEREVRKEAQRRLRLYKELRSRDPEGKRTCKSCLRRVPMAAIKGGYSDVCDDCS